MAKAGGEDGEGRRDFSSGVDHDDPTYGDAGIASAEERKSEAAALRKTLEADREAEEREEAMLHV